MHLLTQLKEKEIFKQDGHYILKSGAESDYYINLKSLVSHPQLLAQVSYALSKLIFVDEIYKSKVALVGVPQGALPLTTMLSYITNLPMMLVRDEKKNYGMQNQIDGEHYDYVVLVEDVITTAMSVLNTIDILKQNKIKVIQILCVVDRQAGGVERLEEFGYRVDVLYKINDFIDPPLVSLISDTCAMGYQLLEISQRKHTKLIVSLDCQNALEVMDIVGPYVCAVKMHRDLFANLDINQLIALKVKHQVLVIEDRKFSDIPYICLQQLQLVKRYADIVTVHGLCGPQLIEQLGNEIAVLIVHNMTCEGHLLDTLYQERVSDFKCRNLVGFVSPKKVKNHLTITTGINLDTTNDNLGQCYKTKSDADLFIVGRGVYQQQNNKDILEAVKRYQELL